MSLSRIALVFKVNISLPSVSVPKMAH